MIAKRVLRGKAGDFGRLSDYIVHGPQKGSRHAQALHAKAAAEAAIWQRTADYIVNALEGGSRAAAVRISNCSADSLEMAIAEIVATQKMNVRAKGDRTYHLVVSFPPGERPSHAQLLDIEDELAAAIGFGKHQRISALHTDTEHLHMHVAINQVHPETGACIEPWYDKRKLMAACERLEIKHNLIRTHGRKRGTGKGPAKPPRISAMERHSGLRSLLCWVRAEAKPALLRAAAGKGWQDLHRALAEHGLEIRPHGAGLVIAQGKLAVKASDVDRLLSAAALQTRWGRFVAADPTLMPPIQIRSVYRREPMHRDIDELFEDWQRLRDPYVAAKAALERKIGLRAESIRTLRRELRDNIHQNSPFTAYGRRDEYAEVDRIIASRWAEERRWIAAKRAEIRREHNVPNWVEFLRQAAANGNGAALKALRRNAKRCREALAAATGASAATDELVLKELRPETTANGTILYRLRDGGIVADDGGSAVIEKDSAIAKALTLTLMASRSSDKTVMIEGPDTHSFIKVAARDRLDLRFCNPDHEIERQRLVRLYAGEEAQAAAAVFIAGRNAERPGTLPHRLWRREDAGAAVYHETQMLDDGVAVVLLRKDDEILVLPRTASKADIHLLPETPMELSADGEILARKGARR